MRHWKRLHKDDAVANHASNNRQAQASIARINWFVYLNPTAGLKVNIDRNLIDAVAPYVGENDLDAAAAIAAFARPHIDRLSRQGFVIGQSEGFLQRPFQAAWHILILDGEAYVSNHEFYPYP